jgi:hypothetical protein
MACASGMVALEARLPMGAGERPAANGHEQEGSLVLLWHKADYGLH